MAAGAAGYLLHGVVHGRIEGQPVLVMLGVLLVGYVQLVYPAVTWLSVGPDGLVLRTLPGRRSVPWTRIGKLVSVSALTLAGRGGNMSGVIVRDPEGEVVLIVPDVFSVGHEALRTVLEAVRSGVSGDAS